MVSGEISRLLQNASLDPPTAASLKEHAMRAHLPIDLIFTSAGKDGSAWASLQIGFGKSLTLLHTSTDNRPDQFVNLKKNVKAAFASSQRCTNSPVSSVQRSLPTGDMSSNVARTASMVFGGMRAATPKEAPRCMKVWIVTEILRLSRGRSLGQHQTLDSTESNGGSSGGCGADPSGAKGGGSGGGGGGGETGGNDTNSNQGGPEPGGSGASMPSVQRACGGAGDAPGAREGTQGNADDDETDEEPGLPSLRKVPCAVGHPVCNVSPRLSCVRGADLPPAISPDDISTRQANLVLHHSHGDQKLTQDCPGEETESDSDVEIDMGVPTPHPVGERANEVKQAEVRDRVIGQMRTAGGQNFGPDMERVVAKILEVYQSLSSEPMRLLSMDGDKMCVLARYCGKDQHVLQPQGPLLPGGQFTIMISQRWRAKARVKNDPAFRHTYNALHMSNRTKHITVRGVTKIQTIRMFPNGASMALFSQDPVLSQRSLVLGATSIAYVEKRFWDSVRGEVVLKDKETLPLLQDTVRNHVRNLLFAIVYFNNKGMALGRAAVDNAGIAENGDISFQDLSQSALYPETNEAHSRQAQSAMNYLDRNNTSWSWDPTEPGQPAPVLARFLSDTTIQALMQKERQSGKGLALPVSADLAGPAHSAQKSKKKAITKDDAFRYDQANVAHALAAALRSPAASPTPAEFAALAVQISRIAEQGQRNTKHKDMIARLAGSRISREHSQSGSWKRCADFLVQSLARETLAKKACSADSMISHLFLTAFIPPLEMEETIRKSGLRVEETKIRFPADWQVKPEKGKVETCDPLQGQVLPAAIIKHDSDLKGVGIFAGRKVGAKVLVLLYIGELEYDSDIRPPSRMVVKKTCGSSWSYCYGIEDLTKCLEIGPALGQYANAPDPGELPNCTLERTKSRTYYDKTGKEFLVFPVFSNDEIAEGTPYLWAYPPSSGRGKSFT